MHVVRFAEAPPYEATGHHAMRMVRLQGREAGPSDTLWLGVSRIEPGGGTTLDANRAVALSPLRGLNERRRMEIAPGPLRLGDRCPNLLEPGGGTTLDASGIEKLYVVLEGELTISNGTEDVVLRPWDSCRIAPNEGRALKNNTDRPATVLLAMPHQAATTP